MAGSAQVELLAASPSAKCAKPARAVRGEQIDLQATGSRGCNGLLRLLHCEAGLLEGRPCEPAQAAYAACHKSVMGTGQHHGAKHCGPQLARFLECVATARGAS